jgi:8-oxo-dGTP pyrophosphatase MutT (NUDIX family)
MHVMSMHAYDANPKWTHAGGVVYRMAGAAPEVLLVRAKSVPHEWVLPKGHIERGETPEQTARRDVREVAGVDAQPLQFVGEMEFDLPRGTHVSAAYFLMHFVRTVPADEHRELRWCSPSEAVALTPFENARDIIRAAGSLITTDLHT